MTDAAAREAQEPILWKLADNASEQIEHALTLALASDGPPRQFWHLSEDGRQITGVVHAMMLPVPPIYAGKAGEPGLIMPDRYVAPDASPDTSAILMQAAEAALTQAGASITLSTSVPGDGWQNTFEQQGYTPLTLYLSRTGFPALKTPSAVRPATTADVPGIVHCSAENRKTLFEIDPFWEFHPEADQRFFDWMTISLGLRDRDMMVLGSPGALQGYVIAQPATRLHFPPAHDIAGTGVIDDYFHPDFADHLGKARESGPPTLLLEAAEMAFARRGIKAVFVVCPAGWRSKRETLEAAGYATAMIWSIKRHSMKPVKSR